MSLYQKFQKRSDPTLLGPKMTKNGYTKGFIKQEVMLDDKERVVKKLENWGDTMDHP